MATIESEKLTKYLNKQSGDVSAEMYNEAVNALSQEIDHWRDKAIDDEKKWKEISQAHSKSKKEAEQWKQKYRKLREGLKKLLGDRA